MVIEGNVAFSSVTKHDSYMGQSTGKYTITVTLPTEGAEKLSSAGVKVKEYEGTPQRKFSSGFAVKVVDAENSPFDQEIPRGSLVRIKYKLGNEHPVHGVSTYLEAVRVLEVADFDGQQDEEDKNF
jgi:hypothetical protein